MEDAPILAVSFDFGQTLAELDTAMLAARCAERGVTVSEAALDGAVMPAWRAYNAAVRAGLGGHPWKLLMRTLLDGAGVDPASRDPLVDWLWDQQPVKNLWRRPIPGMIELTRTLRAQGLRVGVLSNSEGRLAELANELGWGDDFDVIADSGRLGMEKPDRQIFAWTAERLGVPMERVAHVGDAWSADFVGARAAGMRAVLFRGALAMPEGAVFPTDDPRAARCDDAAGLAAILGRWASPR